MVTPFSTSTSFESFLVTISCCIIKHINNIDVIIHRFHIELVRHVLAHSSMHRRCATNTRSRCHGKLQTDSIFIGSRNELSAKHWNRFSFCFSMQENYLPREAENRWEFHAWWHTHAMERETKHLALCILLLSLPPLACCRCRHETLQTQ